MNKTAIKNFAVWARKKLIADICYRAQLLGITEEGIKDPLPQSTGSVQFFDIGTAQPYAIGGAAISQRAHLADAIRQKAQESDYKTAYQSIVEEVAYTWFNRLIAVRFMEVNDYLPSHLRVLSSDSGKLEPDLVTRPFDADFVFSERERAEVARMQQNNAVDELFCLLFIKQCNALHELLPALFERTRDYTELLLSLSVVDREGVVYHLVHDIPEEDFDISRGGQVEIIGWLYQYYNAELNELVYDGKMSKSRVPKELLPAATTIYTPDWVVHYMVENSLGRIWEEGHPSGIKENWKYYLEEAEQPAEVEQKLEALRAKCRALKPQDIKVIDPCMGSGHILVYAFEVLMQIYESQGFSRRDAAQSIVENNLYGLDIDNRAAQLAYFAVLMKARQYDRRFLTRGIRPHIFAIAESNGLDPHTVNYFVGGDEGLKNDFSSLVHDLHDAKEYGSILRISPVNFSALYTRLAAVEKEGSFDALAVQNTVLPLVQVAEVLSRQYDVVVTNPPYLGSARFGIKLDAFIKKNYADVKADSSMVMYKRAMSEMVKINGYAAFVTTNSWMFLSSFEKLRGYIQRNASISSLVDFGTELFEGKVGHNPIVAWVTQNCKIAKNMIAIRLVDYCYSRRDEKQIEFFNLENRYTAQQTNFSKIPGSPIAYWVSEQFYLLFIGDVIGKHFDVKAGICTGKNEEYIMLWHELDFSRSSVVQEEGYLYTPHNKGGEYRKWYGNRESFLKYNPAALRRMENNDGFRHDGKEFYYKNHIGWSKITSAKSSFRFYENGFTFDSAGLGLFSDTSNVTATLGLLNSKIVEYLIPILNPTLNVTPMIVKKLPYIDMNIEDRVCNCISVSKNDWDSYETSWDFKKHPLV